MLLLLFVVAIDSNRPSAVIRVCKANVRFRGKLSLHCFTHGHDLLVGFGASFAGACSMVG